MKLVGCVAAFLRQRGLRFFCYLNVWLLVASSPPLLRQHLALLLQTVQALGFLINWDKSEHVLTQCPIFLGATIDIPRQLARPSPRRIATIVAAARLLCGRRQSAAFSQELSTGPGPPIQTGPPAPDDPPPLPEVEPSGIPALGQPSEGPPTHHTLSLHHFLPLVRHRTVLIRTDNVTVAAYINKQGGTHSTRLNALAAELWIWCRRRDVIPTASYISGQAGFSERAAAFVACSHRESTREAYISHLAGFFIPVRPIF